MVTFSQNGEKRLAEQISTVAQAQQILIEVLLRLSTNDAKISQIVCESLDDIKRVQEQNIYLLSKINHLENISLGIKPDMDVSKLSDKEKEVLAGCLYLLNSKSKNKTDEQQKFANIVISYTKADVQMEMPTAAIDEMNMDSKRRILACCLEYIFLSDCSTKSFNEFEDFIEIFDIGNKTIKSLENQIESLYNLRGLDGLYSKYKSEIVDDIDDFFELEIDTNDDIEDDTIEQEDEYIKSILQIRSDEVKTFKNKNIHISAYINCEGTLELDHCILYYNESEAADELSLSNGASIYFKNSTIVCKGFDKNHFISCKGYNEIVFENCTFLDCSYFLTTYEDINLKIEKCELRNCYGDFLNISNYSEDIDNIEIVDSIIVQDDLSSFHINNIKEFSYPRLFYINCHGAGNVIFSNNCFKEEESFRSGELSETNQLCYIDGTMAEVINCSFEGITTGIKAHKVCESKFDNCKAGIDFGNHEENNIVDNCVFNHCTDVIRTGDNTSITNCQFISCWDYIICAHSLYGGVNIEFCQFVNIKNSLSKEHYRLLDGMACISFRRDKSSKASANYIKKCIFDGISLDDNYLVQANGAEKPSGTVTYIEECDFKNCVTKRKDGKIIKENILYDKLFAKDQVFHANKISDSRGLDRVNKEGCDSSEAKIMTTSLSGNTIGSSITGALVGVVAMGAIPVVGAPISLVMAAGIVGASLLKEK